MPYRKRYKRRKRFKRRRSYGPKRRRYSKRRRINTTVVRGPRYVPDRLVTRLTTVDTLQLTHTAQANQNIGFWLNSIWDPLGGSGSVNPVGYDELFAMYDSVHVTASKIHITVVHQNTNIPMRLALYPTLEAPGANVTAEDACANPYAKMIVLNPTSYGSGNIKTLSSYMTMKSLRGQTPVQSNNLTHLKNIHPLFGGFWYLIGSYDGPESSVSDITVRITHYCSFFRRGFIDPTP